MGTTFRAAFRSTFRRPLWALAICVGFYVIAFLALYWWRGASSAIEQTAALATLGFIPYLASQLVRFVRDYLARRGALDVETTQRRHATGLQEQDDRRMKDWVRTRVSSWRNMPKRVLAFGGVVREHETGDVDVLVQLPTSDMHVARRQSAAIGELQVSFRAAFSKELNVQRFLANEDDAVRAFLRRAEDYEHLCGEELQNGQSTA